MTLPRVLQRFGLIAALLLLSAGCTVVAESVAGSAALAIVDKAVSDYAGKECRLAALITTGSICKAVAAASQPDPVYCFRTLGAVDCYREPDPYTAQPLPGLQRPPALAPAPRPADSEQAPPAPAEGKSAALRPIPAVLSD